MVRTLALALASIALITAPAAALADTMAYSLRASVAVHCTVTHQLAGSGRHTSLGVALGQISELCNAQHGYELVVDYTPGALQGTVLRAGDDEVTLTGSGQAILSRAAGPRALTRDLTARPGAAGFDTTFMQFRMIAAA